jgi:hypothetical protein
LKGLEVGEGAALVLEINSCPRHRYSFEELT